MAHSGPCHLRAANTLIDTYSVKFTKQNNFHNLQYETLNIN